MGTGLTLGLKLEGLYWRLSSFYLFYFTVLGALLPYWGPYLKSRGFSSIEIGHCFAMLTASKLVAPTFWGWLGDRSGQQLWITRIASIIALLIFCIVAYTSHYLVFLFAMLMYGVFWYACLPQFEVITLHSLGQQAHHYSKIRMWGSIGFILSVMSAGPLMDWFGGQSLPYIIILMIVAVSISSFLVPSMSVKPVVSTVSNNIRTIILQPKIILLLLVSFIMQLSHAPYYAFFSIYAENLGYSKWNIGLFWSLGVGAEIFVFMMMHRLLPKYGAYHLLLICFASTVIRWLLIALAADNVYLLILVQCLHAFSFGMFHSVMISLIYENFKGGFHGRGQALYSSISFGAGGALGSYASGYLWTLRGSTDTFLVAALIAGIGLLVTALGLKNFRR